MKNGFASGGVFTGARTFAYSENERAGGVDEWEHLATECFLERGGDEEAALDKVRGWV